MHYYLISLYINLIVINTTGVVGLVIMGSLLRVWEVEVLGLNPVVESALKVTLDGRNQLRSPFSTHFFIIKKIEANNFEILIN